MKLTSKKTYKIVGYLLERKAKSQQEIASAQGVSAGQVNKVVCWLEAKGCLIKDKGGYEIKQPVKVLEVFALERSMKELKTGTFEVDAPREELLEWLKGRGTFCLTSALQCHDKYFRDPAIQVYGEGIAEELGRFKAGLLRVEVYKKDLELDTDTEEKDGIRVTTKVRTVIDLFCDGKAYAAERLIARLWG